MRSHDAYPAAIQRSGVREYSSPPRSEFLMSATNFSSGVCCRRGCRPAATTLPQRLRESPERAGEPSAWSPLCAGSGRLRRQQISAQADCLARKSSIIAHVVAEAERRQDSQVSAWGGLKPDLG